MTFIDWLTLGLAVLTAGGLIGTWIRSSRAELREHAQIESNISNKIEGLKKENTEIKDLVQHPDYGLMAIKNAQTEQQINCARTTSAFSEQIRALRDRADRLNGTTRRRKKT